MPRIFRRAFAHPCLRSLADTGAGRRPPLSPSDGSTPHVRPSATALMLRSRAAQQADATRRVLSAMRGVSKHEGGCIARPHPSRRAHGRSSLPCAFVMRAAQDEHDSAAGQPAWQLASTYGRPPRPAKSWATSVSMAIALATSALPASASPFLIFAIPRPKSGSAHSGSSRNAAS
jgi:hypothetical protein